MTRRTGSGTTRIRTSICLDELDLQLELEDEEDDITSIDPDNTGGGATEANDNNTDTGTKRPTTESKPDLWNIFGMSRSKLNQEIISPTSSTRSTSTSTSNTIDATDSTEDDQLGQKERMPTNNNRDRRRRSSGNKARRNTHIGLNTTTQQLGRVSSYGDMRKARANSFKTRLPSLKQAHSTSQLISRKETDRPESRQHKLHRHRSEGRLLDNSPDREEEGGEEDRRATRKNHKHSVDGKDETVDNLKQQADRSGSGNEELRSKSQNKEIERRSRSKSRGIESKTRSKSRGKDRRSRSQSRGMERRSRSKRRGADEKNKPRRKSRGHSVEEQDKSPQRRKVAETDPTVEGDASIDLMAAKSKESSSGKNDNEGKSKTPAMIGANVRASWSGSSLLSGTGTNTLSRQRASSRRGTAKRRASSSSSLLSTETKRETGRRASLRTSRRASSLSSKQRTGGMNGAISHQAGKNLKSNGGHDDNSSRLSMLEKFEIAFLRAMEQQEAEGKERPTMKAKSEGLLKHSKSARCVVDQANQQLKGSMERFNHSRSDLVADYDWKQHLVESDP